MNSSIQPKRPDPEPATKPSPVAAHRTTITKSLLHARESVMRQLRPVLRAHGLTEQQWRVLSDLVPADEVPASTLAAGTCLRASSLSRIIKDLEGRGFLSRRSQLEDLRRTMVSISPRGRAVMDQLAPVTAGLYADMADRFGRDHLDTLVELSDGLALALGGAGDPDDADA